MAVNLNPGADATLVQAATNAAMANVPKDLSQMFQAQTENYRKTMESVGESYGKMISTVAAVAAPFAKEAIQRQKMTNFGHSDVAASLDAEMSGAFTDIRERTKATYLLPKGERAIERKKIQRDRDKLFAQVKDMQGFILNTGDRVASGDFDQKSTPLQNQIFAQGIANAGQPLSSETKFKGFKSVSIEQDGARGWQHEDAEGNLISSIDKYGNVILADEDNKAMFTPNADVGGLLKDKLDDKTKAFFQSIDLNALNGKVSLTGREVSIANQAGEAVTEKNIGGLLNEQWGNQPNSFMDDLHSESKLSVGMFNALKGVKGLKDVPGTAPGIDKADFASPENMAILNGAMTPGSLNYNFEEAKKAYTSWFAGNVVNSSNLSENLKKKQEGLFPTIEKGKTLDLGGEKIPKESLDSYYNDIEAGNEFKIGDYTYTPRLGGWEKSDIPNGVIGEYEDTADLLKNGLGPGGRHEGFKGVKQFDEKASLVSEDQTNTMREVFGPGKEEDAALSNLETLFRDEPALEGMFRIKTDGDDAIFFNGKKYDVTESSNFFKLRNDIDKYLKENKKEETGAATEQGATPVAVVSPEAEESETVATTPPAAVVDSTTSSAVTPEGTTSVQDQYTQQEVSSANPFNESVNKETGLPSKGSAASTHSEYKGRDVESGPTTTFEFSKSFVKAVGNDEKAIQRYIKQNPDVYPGVEIITDGVEGNDAFIVKVNGKEKKFQADPKTRVKYGTVGSNDQRRALEIHDWIQENSREKGEKMDKMEVIKPGGKVGLPTEPTFPGFLPEVEVDGNKNIIKEGPNKGKPSTWSVIKPGAFELNQGLMDSIVTNEGFVEGGLPYKDTGGLPTIGFGYTKYSLDGKDGRPLMSEYWKDGKATGKVMTKENAIMLQPLVASIYKDQVDNSVTNKSINAEQYNVLVDLAYRNGNGNVKSSGIYKAINKGDIKGAIEILKTSKALYKVGGKVEYAENGTDFKKNGIYKRNMDLVAKLEKSLKPNLG